MDVLLQQLIPQQNHTEQSKLWTHVKRNRRAAAGSPPDQWWKRKSDPLLKKSTNTHDFSKISEVLWMGGDGKVDKTHEFGVEDQGSVPTVTHSPMCP